VAWGKNSGVIIPSPEGKAKAQTVRERKGERRYSEKKTKKLTAHEEGCTAPLHQNVRGEFLWQRRRKNTTRGRERKKEEGQLLAPSESKSFEDRLSVRKGVRGFLRGSKESRVAQGCEREKGGKRAH